MTREEAIKWIEYHIAISDYEETDDLNVALHIAIKALSTEIFDDAISRKDLIEFLEKVTVTDGITFETGFKQILTDIRNAPSVQPKRQVGHWIFPNPSTEMICECSLCGGNGRAFGKDNYCPNCGAKMVEPQESEE